MVRYHDPTIGRTDPDERAIPTGLRRRTVLGALAATGVAGAARPAAADDVKRALGGDESVDPDAAAVQEDEVPVGTDALLDYLEAKYGDQLSEDQLEQVRTRLAGILASGETVSAFELEYTTGPAYTFQPYRGDD